MQNTNSFLRFLNKFVDLSEDEFNTYIAPHIQERSFKKKESLISQGKVENYVNFITAGLVRKYIVVNDVEFIVMLCRELQLTTEFESFYNRTPAEMQIEAIENTHVLSIHYDDLQLIYTKSPKMEMLGRRVVSFAMILKDRWQLQMAKLTPRERFLEFVKERPQMLQRVPQKHLASFLNIQPETFSRFKHLLKDKV